MFAAGMRACGCGGALRGAVVPEFPVFVPGARAAELMAGKCGTCNGRGRIWVQVVGGPKGREAGEWQACPSCGGTGEK